MKLTTTFWSDEVHEFDKLLFIKIKKNNQSIVFEADLKSSFLTAKFFKDISKFVKSKSVYKEKYEKQEFYQFAVMQKGEIMPIKWFDLVINDNLIISHDIAFETTLIRKNGFIVPFGKFPIWYGKNPPKFSVNREFKIKSNAYKYLANRVLGK